MRKWILLVIVLSVFTLHPAAQTLQAPTVPDSGAAVMPQSPDTFAQGLYQLIQSGIYLLSPSLKEAASVCSAALAILLIQCLLGHLCPTPYRRSLSVLSGILLACTLYSANSSMLALAENTIQELTQYGKILTGVLATGLAAQGGVSSSAALYAGFCVFQNILSALVSGVLVPMVFLFLLLGICGELFPRELLKQFCAGVKSLLQWCMKVLLYAFTGFMTITGVISGTADALAVKATKLTISSMIPVVGGILSDASETVLVSASLLKNAAGVYGMLAILSVCLMPFLKIGCQYLLLKLCSAVGETVDSSVCCGILKVYTGAMGFALAMTGTVCLMLLISTVCFMKGMS